MSKRVGHYGVFSGSRFRNEIYPVISDFAYRAGGDEAHHAFAHATVREADTRLTGDLPI